jgi:predicted SprT family Zn-dependent metalloprotease
MTQCNQTRYGQQQAEAAVRRRRNSYAYRCQQCGSIHIAEGKRDGRVLELSNSEGRLITHFRGEIRTVSST